MDIQSKIVIENGEGHLRSYDCSDGHGRFQNVGLSAEVAQLTTERI